MDDMKFFVPKGPVKITMLTPHPWTKYRVRTLSQGRGVLCWIHDCPICWSMAEGRLQDLEQMRWADDGGLAND